MGLGVKDPCRCFEHLSYIHAFDIWRELVHIWVDGYKTSVTPNHPYWVIGKAWVNACELTIVDQLITNDGRIVSIQKIDFEDFFEPITVYNFEVEGNTPDVYNNTTGGHKLVYDSDGRLNMDISSERVKAYVWNQDPSGTWRYNKFKLKGDVPSELLTDW